jgi:hypothetical protein
MNSNHLSKIFIIICIGCLLLSTFLPLLNAADAFILPTFFGLTVFLKIIAVIFSFQKTKIPTRPHVIYQLRAPPFPLF